MAVIMLRVLLPFGTSACSRLVVEPARVWYCGTPALSARTCSRLVRTPARVWYVPARVWYYRTCSRWYVHLLAFGTYTCSLCSLLLAFSATRNMYATQYTWLRAEEVEAEAYERYGCTAFPFLHRRRAPLAPRAPRTRRGRRARRALAFHAPRVARWSEAAQRSDAQMRAALKAMDEGDACAAYRRTPPHARPGDAGRRFEGTLYPRAKWDGGFSHTLFIEKRGRTCSDV